MKTFKYLRKINKVHKVEKDGEIYQLVVCINCRNVCAIPEGKNIFFADDHMNCCKKPDYYYFILHGAEEIIDRFVKELTEAREFQIDNTKTTEEIIFEAKQFTGNFSKKTKWIKLTEHRKIIKKLT